MTETRIRELAGEVGYRIRNEEAWECYCYSVMNDSSVTEGQIKKELAAYKGIEEGLETMDNDMKEVQNDR